MRVPEMPGSHFPGKVTRIADALQPGTRTLLTEVDVPNPDGALAAGIYCTVELRIPRKTPSLLVPADAIIFNQNGMQVAVVENGVAHLHKIAITADNGTEVEVNEGVKEAEVILQPPVEPRTTATRSRSFPSGPKLHHSAHSYGGTSTRLSEQRGEILWSRPARLTAKNTRPATIFFATRA